jgi:hypothetical protein
MALATLSDSLPDAVASAAASGAPPANSSAAASGAPPSGSSGAVAPGATLAGSSDGPGPGLSARMSSLAAALGSLVADLDPGLLVGADACALYADFALLERLVVAGKTLLAPRIATSGHWEAEGHRSPVSLLATLEGVSAGQARRTLETGQRVAQLPSTEEALRQGTLSGPKVAEIAQAASVDPAAESTLLSGSDAEPLHVVKERCQRVRATSAKKDPLATLARIHAQRTFTSWTDAEGAFCFQGRDTAERGARLLARLDPVANRLRSDRRAAARDAAAGRPKGAPAPTPESEAALRADAFFLLFAARGPTPLVDGDPEWSDPPGPGAGSSTGPGTDSGTDPGTDSGSGASTSRSATATPTPGPASRSTTGSAASATPPEPVLAGPDDLITARPPATVIVRVDLAALRRGRALPGELCELDGHGPVPVPVAAGLADDSFLCLVFTEAGDIKAVSHRGRTINQHLRTGLVFRDRCCVVPRCGVAYGLEIDHVVPMEEGGLTRLDNLALLCHHHHRMKTYDGWILARTGPTDEDPGWTFTPQPPFGQEPGLGIDRPPEAVPRN